MSGEESGRRSSRWRGDAPTEPLPLSDLLHRTPFAGAQPQRETTEDAHVAEILDLCARVGELMIRCGAGAPQVETAVVALATASGMRGFEIDITLQSLHLQATSRSGGVHSVLRVVRSTRHDYARLVAVHELVEAIVAGKVSLEDAGERLREIKTHPRNWPMWAVSLANAVLASAVAVMIGASAAGALASFVVVLLVRGVNRVLAEARLPEFFANAVNAAAATLLAGAAYAAAASGWVPLRADDFAYIVAGGIVAMLPGRTMASAIEDVLFGYPLTGAGRLLSVSLALSGLIIGVAAGLSIMLRVTRVLNSTFVPPSVLDLEISSAPWIAAVLAAFVVGLSGSVTVQSRRKLLVPAAVLCAIGAGALALLTRTFDIGYLSSTGLAAIIVGFAGRLVAVRLHLPPMTLVVPASFGLLPGLTIFRALYAMVAETGTDAGLLSLQSGFTTLLGAGAALLAIATGTVFGEILASPWDRRVSSVRSR
jgi:uncharacterized membrane protein YjjP (DUF1212 family)